MNSPSGPVARTGRARATNSADLGEIGLRLILERGFDQVTVDDIAAAAGIGRRTFFRYFPSKNDLPWGDFDPLLDRMREHLAEVPPRTPLAQALRDAVVEFNTFPAGTMRQHRERMSVLLESPTLVAHSTLRYTEWRRVIAEFTADRLGIPTESVQADAIARVCLGVTLAAYEHWLADADADLTGLIREAFDEVSDVFGQGPGPDGTVVELPRTGPTRTAGAA